jgi:hypothetical protein
MAEHGIVGRGVLLDYHSWREAQDPPIPYDAFKSGSIPLKHLKATAEAQGTNIKFGDILLIRSGLFMFLYSQTSQKDSQKDSANQLSLPRVYGCI